MLCPQSATAEPTVEAQGAMAKTTEENSVTEPGDTTGGAEPLITATPLVTEASVHPKAAEIIRQVDFYFSEENLRQDAHLLGLIQQGNGLVSLNELLSWRKMRKYRPMSAVREAIKQSTVVEVVGNKRLRRREPLKGPVYVTPKVNEQRQRAIVPEDKPWLTKSMLKPTGFEDGATNGPIRPEEYEEDREAYEPCNSFPQRIETAIMKFCARRKMHQQTRVVWERFLMFGGFETGQRQFNGGLEDSSMEDYTKREIAELTSSYEVADEVIRGLYEDGPTGKVTWIVDFDALAKGFLSSRFMQYFDWYNLEWIGTATTVLRSFYNYILYHDVCPEYHDQILRARQTCDLAMVEFPKLKIVDINLPGRFNVACSTLFGGYYSGLYAAAGDWVNEEDRLGLSHEDAKVIFLAGVAAYGTESQWEYVQASIPDDLNSIVAATFIIGLEVTQVSLATAEAKSIYSDPSFTDTVVQPMGKLHCTRWNLPHRGVNDRTRDAGSVGQSEDFYFLVEESTLQHCFPGLKLEVEIKQLENGIQWIDRVEHTYPSFFTWLRNEDARRYKKKKVPKGWGKQEEADKQGGEPHADPSNVSQSKSQEAEKDESGGKVATDTDTDTRDEL